MAGQTHSVAIQKTFKGVHLPALHTEARSRRPWTRLAARLAGRLPPAGAGSPGWSGQYARHTCPVIIICSPTLLLLWPWYDARYSGQRQFDGLQAGVL